MVAILGAYIAVLPLIQLGLLRVSPGKTLVPLDLVFIALVLAVLAQRRARLRGPDWGLLLAASATLLATGAATMASREPRAGLADLARTGYSLCVLVVLSHVRLAPAEASAVRRFWCLMAAVVSLLGLAGYAAVVVLGLKPGLLAAANSPHLGRGVVRVAGVLPSNTLSLLVLVSLPFLGAARAVDRRAAGWLAIGFAACLLAGVLSFSRGLAGILICLALQAFALRDDWPAIFRARWLLVGLATAASTIASATAVWQILPVGRPAKTYAVDGRHAGYFVLHKAGLRMLAANPWLGVGPDAFGREFAAYTNGNERQASWPRLSARLEYDPHSFWIGRAAETGAVGLGAWLLLFAVLLARTGAAPQDGAPLQRRLTACAIAGLIFNGLHTDFMALKFVWAAVGLGVAHAECAETRPPTATL
jgi:O-antigen ligase